MLKKKPIYLHTAKNIGQKAANQIYLCTDWRIHDLSNDEHEAKIKKFLFPVEHPGVLYFPL